METKRHFFDARAGVEEGQILAHLPYLTYSDRITDDRGTYRELLYPGCFTIGDDLQIYPEHSGPSLGSVKEGNLKVRSDDQGLWIRFTPRTGDSKIYNDVVTGKLDGLSPGFKVYRDRFGEFHGEQVRQIFSASLIEVSLTSQPAYFGASSCVQKRSKKKPGTESRIVSFGDGYFGIIEEEKINWSLGVLR